MLTEVEAIVYSGTKINIDYFLNEVMDQDVIQDVYDYFESRNRITWRRHKKSCQIIPKRDTIGTYQILSDMAIKLFLTGIVIKRG